jgi:hypothetical protein
MFATLAHAMSMTSPNAITIGANAAINSGLIGIDVARDVITA